MGDTLAGLVWPFAGGGLIGALYFGLLWLTISQMRTARRPGLVLFSSMAARLAIAVTGFYLVSAGRGDRLLACLAGFIGIRVLMISRIRPRSTGDAAGQAGRSLAGGLDAAKGGDGAASDT